VPQPARRRTEAAQFANVLEPRLRSFRGDLTVADAAARGGLALRSAEAGLYHLASEYRGHLKATSEGEIVFSFPEGLTRPLGQGALARAGRVVVKLVRGVARFVVRAWVTVVVVGYALVLLGVLIALALKDDSGDGIGDALAMVFRAVAEALFWTFHPFSPVMWQREPRWTRFPTRKRQPKVPFYEKVNRFVFGPPQVRVDDNAQERALVAEIRRLEGRIAPGDVMRVTGGTREQAEAALCRLMIDQDGEVQVSDEGAVLYQFPALRRTADPTVEHAPPPAPIWETREKLPALTGNSAGTNVFLGLINGFNLAASGVVLSSGLTLDRIGQLVSARLEDGPLPIGPGGVPIVLGAIPFVFSTVVFALPAARVLMKRARARRVAIENGRRAVLRAVLAAAVGETVPSVPLRRAWVAAGAPPLDEAQLTAEVRRLGGEPDVDEGGQVVYRFPDLARETRALAAARRSAPADERSPGEVIFSSLDSDES
jgi:uncharacterized membrane protein